MEKIPQQESIKPKNEWVPNTELIDPAKIFLKKLFTEKIIVNEQERDLLSSYREGVHIDVQNDEIMEPLRNGASLPPFSVKVFYDENSKPTRAKIEFGKLQDIFLYEKAAQDFFSSSKINL